MVRNCRGIPGAGTAPRRNKVDLHQRGPAGGAHGVFCVSPRASIINFVKIGKARRPVENGH